MGTGSSVQGRHKSPPPQTSPGATEPAGIIGAVPNCAGGGSFDGVAAGTTAAALSGDAGSRHRAPASSESAPAGTTASAAGQGGQAARRYSSGAAAKSASSQGRAGSRAVAGSGSAASPQPGGRGGARSPVGRATRSPVPADGDAADANPEAHGRLLDEYAVGQQLGQGAFGVVSLCTKRSTGDTFAVKMVDKVETPVQAITKEADMLRSLDHPNIVKVHAVFNERFFVCIIMDAYFGGDLVEGLQKHLKEHGQIKCHKIVHVMKQMTDGIAYLHNRLVVHRDIKGDNYLSDKKDFVEPDSKVVLTDFGTAVTIKPDERLSQAVGTKIFWSPEFYDRNYAAKVDVFALGIVLYGLVTGRFPFRDEKDSRTKQVKVPPRVDRICEDLILRMLEKQEQARLSAQEAADHPWLSGVDNRRGSTGMTVSEEDDGSGGAALREQQVNDGVKERRQVLMDRLNEMHRARREGPVRLQRTMHYTRKSFQLPDKTSRGSKITYEWWDSARVQSSGLLDVESRATQNGEGPTPPGSDVRLFKKQLEEHNINHEVFGQNKAKTLPELAAEVQSGACRLMLDANSHKKLVRVVDVVLFRLRSEDGASGRLLIETEERFADGRRRDTVRLPGTKKEPHENSRQTAERILRDMLGMRVEHIQFDFGSLVRFEEETDSPSYPGVRTVYRKEILEAVVKESDPATLAAIGLPSFAAWSAVVAKDGVTKTYEWWTEETAIARRVKFKAVGAEVVSTLVRAPIGLDEDQLRSELEGAGIDSSLYGQRPRSKTLRDFSAELVRGESTLERGADGVLNRVVDVVMLVIEFADTGAVLVQTEHENPSGHKTALNRLPGAKSRPDENVFLSARRILRRQLEIDDNMAEINPVFSTVEERRPGDAYPGLRTVYRKRLIHAKIVGGQSDGALLR
mmetsp:Transcript_127422/g.366466  ORF Transcript_127422/g.366466 Transcript_127422/m.366466 type:complete len:911 (+) Transcript_127422:101-2833(+)